MNSDLILNSVIELVKRVGKYQIEQQSTFDRTKIEKKGLNDLVSYVDKESEKMLVDGLERIYPEAGFIVEENTKSERKEWNWIVDPLDGTTNFIHGIPCYAVSIALERNEEIQLGVVYNVPLNECFSAAKGNGAYLNGKRIEVTKTDALKDSLIATGFPIYNFKRQEAYLNMLRDLMQNTHGIRRIGAAAVDLCYVACGRVDVFYEYNLSPWDVAAGALIAKESGAIVSDFSKGDNWLFGKEIIASNPNLYDQFTGHIIKHFNIRE
ncbi:MAG: inositol monophosphatase family protein [Bacteroidia bacterium]